MSGSGGPLEGVTVIELGGLGAVPFAGMLLADLGATVICCERGGTDVSSAVADPLRRGKRSLLIDLKAEGSVRLVERMVTAADVVLEGFRPGVAERLGVGPKDCHAVNPQLVYGRMTGFGQVGPLAQTAGHDVNFVGLAGVLKHVGSSDRPPVLPLNLVGDYAGGGMLLALGVVSALLRARATGEGDVVDSAMVDGSSLLMSMFYGLLPSGDWSLERGTNAFDGGSPFVNVYETRDGEYMAVGSVESHFYRALIEQVGLSEDLMHPQSDRARWPERIAALRSVFLSRTRDEWVEQFATVEACVTPVLSMIEAVGHPHAVAREAFVTIGGVIQPAPAPRFERARGDVPRPPPRPGSDLRKTLAMLGLSSVEVDEHLALKTVLTSAQM